MEGILELKQSVLDLLKSSEYSIDDLKLILDPNGTILSTNQFLSNLQKIVEVLTKDRNNDSKFTVDDLEYLSEDVIGITNLVSSIILILHGLPDFSIKYEESETEELIFRILVYVVLVVIPEETQVDWTPEERDAILTLLATLYNVLLSYKITQQAISSIVGLFTSTPKWCCFGNTAEIKEETVQKHLPTFNARIRSSTLNTKDKISMNREINDLKQKIQNM